MQIMEVIAILCIPVNMGIIYFTGDGNLNTDGRSSYEKFTTDNLNWTAKETIIFIVLMEHVLLIMKLVVAALIDDVPAQVIQAEKKRVFIEDRAKKFMLVQKLEHKDFKTHEELQQVIQDAKKAEKERIASVLTKLSKDGIHKNEQLPTEMLNLMGLKQDKFTGLEIDENEKAQILMVEQMDRLDNEREEATNRSIMILN